MYTLSEVTAASHRAALLVHAVDMDGNPACKRVKVDNLCGYANPVHTRPTCPVCLKKWQALTNA